jgi:hypothetical protein
LSLRLRFDAAHAAKRVVAIEFQQVVVPGIERAAFCSRDTSKVHRIRALELVGDGEIGSLQRED